MIYLTLIGQCLFASAGMLWNILWALILGFALSAMVMVFIPKKRMTSLLGRGGPKEIGLATFFGAISSSCSYAAAAMAKSLFKKGAHIIPALAFMIASTNLVMELSAILWIMMGWRFFAAEFLGGIILVAIMALLMKILVPPKIFESARASVKEAGESPGESHSHAESDDDHGDWAQVGRSFVSEWKMLWKDIFLGVGISGFLMVLVPNSFWQTLFLQDGNPEKFNLIRLIENCLVAPLISMMSFVCSVGNIPLANVLYHGGLSFGGTLSLIYSDLLIIPLIIIYKKYFGTKMAIWITGIYYTAMVLTGILVDFMFYFLGWIPSRPPEISTASEHMKTMNLFTWNYTSWLNIVFSMVAILLIWLSRKRKQPAACCH